MIMSLSYIANAVNGKLSESANANRLVEGFYSDSRMPSENKLFLALRGERVDGNSFVPSLVESGYAVLTDSEDNLSLKGDVIFVNDVRLALQQLARNYRENELAKLPIVGITGSVGKTTTKDMVAHALSSCLNVHKTIGNSNSQIGLPQTVLATDPDSDCAVVELGMSMKGEMERIAFSAMPDISIITNIGYSHIENLGSREAIRDEKLQITAFSKDNSILLLNGDEPLLKNIGYDNRIKYYVSTEDKNCDCYAENIISVGLGLQFTANVFGKRVEVEMNVSGKHYVLNALFALATCHLLNVNLIDAAKRLATYESDGKRQHIYKKDGHIIISDCYNASPESMKAALEVLSAYDGRRIAVLGDMLELGEKSVELHKLVGEYTNNCADILIAFGTCSTDIYNNSKLSEKYHFSLEERGELLSFLKEFVREGDIVLYKASNGIKLSEVIV